MYPGKEAYEILADLYNSRAQVCGSGGIGGEAQPSHMTLIPTHKHTPHAYINHRGTRRSFLRLQNIVKLVLSLILEMAFVKIHTQMLIAF